MEKEAIELAAFRLRDIAILWYNGWERSRGRDALPTNWENFSNASLDQYAPSIVATMWDMIHRFIAGLAPELTEACATAALQDSMDISRIQAFFQNIERGRRQQLGTERTELGQRKRMRFSRSQEQSQVIEWVGNIATPRGRFISYLKARKMIAKGCIYHIVRVRDVDAEIPTLQSIPVVKEYTDVFPDVLPGIPLEREIDFGLDLLLGTQLISIPLYRMAPAELKELKEQLKDLLEKGKANVVADALSRQSMGSLAHVEDEKRKLTREIHQLACLGVRLVNSGNGGVVLQNTTKSSLTAEEKERQYEDPGLVELREQVPQ
ncbi:uncharacterized protein [Nicotiana tomentosiformis]|uniref:uncharacterized protein n=1 Tax=Nicotiana tomentosiformis TaxID=4098 RepID=UPI00388C8EB3